MTQFTFDGIGTKWVIDIYKKLSERKEGELLSKIKARVSVFDKAYSRFREDSLVTKMSRETGTFLLPEDAELIMKLYKDLYDLTGGLVTPLVGNLISDAGYDAKYSLKQKGEFAPVPAWDEVMEYIKPHLHIKKPVILDFGAAGKGYLVDLVGKVLEENGVFEYCIDAGGDILHKGSVPIRIGLENPENIKEVVGVYTLQNGSICGSAGNRRVWGNFTHIFNPKTLKSQKSILAVWVVAKTAIVADALATCLFFVPASTLTKSYDFEYLLIHNDRSVEKSANFSDEIFTA